MTDTTERVDRLEEALMKLAHTRHDIDRDILDLRREVHLLQQRFDALERYDDAAGLSARVAKKAELDDVSEMRREQRVMYKQWCERANKLGTIVEDIIYPSVRRIAREHFGAPEEMEFEAQRLKRRPLAADRREFDGVFVWEGHVLLLEAKATVRPEYLEAFDAFVRAGRLFEYFPEYAGRRLIPVFSALALAEAEVAWLTDHRLYAVAMGEDAMELLNAQALQG